MKEDAFNLYGLNTNASEWSFESCKRNKDTKSVYGCQSFTSEPYKIECREMKKAYQDVGFRCVIPKDSIVDDLKRFLIKTNIEK